MAAFTGERGAPARGAPDLTTAIADAARRLRARQTPTTPRSSPRCARAAVPADARCWRSRSPTPSRRVAVETFAELADRYDVWLEAGREHGPRLADRLRVARRRCPTLPGGVRLRRRGPGTRRAAAHARRADAHLRLRGDDAPKPSNMALVFDPDGRLVSKQVKTYLTPIELPGPARPRARRRCRPALTRGRHAGRHARLRHVQGRLDARRDAALDQAGVEILVQPEFFVDDTVAHAAVRGRPTHSRARATPTCCATRRSRRSCCPS